MPRPPTEIEVTVSSPSNSLERNIKPSELRLLKKSTELSPSSGPVGGEVMKSSSHSEIIEEFNRKITKSESFKSTQSSSGSTRSRDTKSTASPSGSLERAKNAGSRESLLFSTSGNIQDKIKSFESVSSINSDTKIGQISNEPYYDTVPNEQADDKSDDDNKNFKPESPERASNYVNIDYFLK
jgi:hypothetical protein